MLTARVPKAQTPLHSGSLPPAPFVWTRSETLALAPQSCARCFGLGMCQQGNSETPCHCVYRKIFQICYGRFRRCIEGARVATSSVYQDNYGASPHCGRRHMYGFRNEEFCADFLHVAHTALARHPLLSRVFRYHFLLGADFRAVNRKLGRPTGDRGTFHYFYRIEEIVGRAFRETQPYALFPLDEYFGGTVRQKCKVIPFPVKASA